MKTITDKEWLNFSIEDQLSFTGVRVWNNGTIQYFKNGKYHRDEGQGPQYEAPNGSKEWRINHLLHRLDGPAIVNSTIGAGYFVHGKSYSVEEYWKHPEVIMYKIKNSKEFKDLQEYKNL